VLSQIINYISEKSEYEVYLILYGKKREVLFHINENVHIIKPNFEYNDYPSPISFIKTLLFVRKSVLTYNIDIIVSFEEVWNRFVLLATLGIRRRKVISNRNNPYYDNGLIDSVLAKILYPQADVLIAQTKIAKEVYEKRYNLKKCVVIGNPFKKLERSNEILKDNIILSVGRLMNSKNHDKLIKAFSKTNNRGWKLIIVGGDFANHNNMQRLTHLINEFNLQRQVILAGAQKDVNSYLQKSKIFAFTSSKEGFPNVIGEAMAAGLPVISYDCVAGPSEMIDHGFNGFLIPLYDDELYVKKLQYLMDNSEERKVMGENSFEKIGQFDSEVICEKFYNIITTNKFTD